MLSREEIVALPAGRELDQLIEVHIMQTRIPPKGFHINPKHYSTDIAAAWEVVEKMREEHKQFITIHDNAHLNYDVRFSKNESGEYVRLSNIAHAISRAALLSLLKED